jgi:cytochrome P450
MNRLTLQIAARALFGTDLAEQAESVGAALQAVMDGFIPRLGALFLVPDWLPTPANRRLRQALRELDDTMDGIVARRRASGEERNDLLSLLLGAADEGVLTPRQVREHATTYLLAGHETTALVLSWAWHLLGTHPQAAARLTEEVDAVLGSRPATTADVPKLKYAERIALEAMRLYPPIWAMARVALRDDEIGGYAIRGGTVVIVSPWVAHRDPRYYSAPEAFDPDRWADEAMKQLPRYSYFPFGGGPRGCIGSRFATQEAVLLLATMQLYGMKVTYIVCNDDCFGAVRDNLNEGYGAPIGHELVNPDFVKLAEAYGMRGVKASTPAEIGVALKKALDGDVSTLFEVPLELRPGRY